MTMTTTWRGSLAIVAVAFNGFLFWLMDRMIDDGGAQAPIASDSVSIDFLPQPVEPQTRTRDRRPPPPPKPEPVDRPQARMDNPLDMAMQALAPAAFTQQIDSLLHAGPGVGLSNRSAMNSMQVVDANSLMPISRLPPQYPMQALSRGIEGWVEIVFRIDARGMVEDPAVVNADPEGVFEDAALRAVGRWRFNPPAETALGRGRLAKIRVEFILDRDDAGG